MDLKTFIKSTQETTTVLVEYIPNADKLAPTIIIHKIGASEITVPTGRVLHKLTEKFHDNVRQYVFGVPLNMKEQMTLLNYSEAKKLAWFNKQLDQNDVKYVF